MKNAWKSVLIALVIAFGFNLYRSLNASSRTAGHTVPSPAYAAPPPALPRPAMAPAAPAALPVTSIPLWFPQQVSWKEKERASDGWYLKKNLTESSQALGFSIGEAIAVESLVLPTAEARAAINGDYLKLTTRYQPAIAELKRRMLESGLTQAQLDEVQAKLAASMRDQLGKMPAGDLESKLPAAITLRVSDGYEGGVHRLLMAYHPEVCERPIAELEWNLTQRVDTTQFPKFATHKPVITIPRSWRMEPGKGAHIAVTCADARNQYYAMVGVTDLPASTPSAPELVFPDLLAGIRESDNGLTVVRSGYTKVYGKVALWYFATNTRVSAESTSYQRIIGVWPLVNGALYTVMFRADSVLSEANAEERMGRLQPMAMRMLSVMTLD